MIGWRIINCIQQRSRHVRPFLVYSYNGSGVRFCAQHRLDGMVNVRNRRCEGKDCTKVRLRRLLTGKLVRSLLLATFALSSDAPQIRYPDSVLAESKFLSVHPLILAGLEDAPRLGNGQGLQRLGSSWVACKGSGRRRSFRRHGRWQQHDSWNFSSLCGSSSHTNLVLSVRRRWEIFKVRRKLHLSCRCHTSEVGCLIPTALQGYEPSRCDPSSRG